MNKASGNILILLVGGILMIYTAYRSLHVVQSTLPPEAQIVGYAALAGLDGALICWTVFKARRARGEKQNAIGTFMICLQLAGITATLIGDTVLTANPNDLTRDYLRTVTLWAVPLIIATNVAATVIVHLVDPAQEIYNARRDVRDEIERQVADHLRQNAAQIAARVTPAAAEHRAGELLAEFMRQSMPVSGAATVPETKPAAEPDNTSRAELEAPAAALPEDLRTRLLGMLAQGQQYGALSPEDAARVRDFLAATPSPATSPKRTRNGSKG